MIDIALLQRSLPFLLRGAVISLQIAALACCIGFALGTMLGVLQAKRTRFLRYIIAFYTTIIRGTPMLIQIAFAYFVLPEFGVNLSAFWIAVVAIGLNSSAYVSQIIRSGIASVSKGQIEAAKVLGLNNWQITRYIVLPQAISMVLPALGNEFITLVKDSSLASTIGVMELTKEAALIKSRTYDALTTYVAVTLCYLLMTMTLSFLLTKLEKRMTRHVGH